MRKVGDMNSQLMFALFLVLLALTAFFNLAEMALVAARASKLESAQNAKAADNVLTIKERPGLFLAAIRAGDLITDLLIGAFVTVDLPAMATPPAYVAEYASVLSVLETLKRIPLHAVVVVDEFGSLMGLVTLADVLEAVAGDVTIGSPGDAEERPPKKEVDGSYVVPGHQPVDDIVEALLLPARVGRNYNIRRWRDLSSIDRGESHVKARSSNFLRFESRSSGSSRAPSKTCASSRNKAERFSDFTHCRSCTCLDIAMLATAGFSPTKATTFKRCAR
jgi:CBS domain containing-hemolysin-like protein